MILFNTMLTVLSYTHMAVWTATYVCRSGTLCLQQGLPKFQVYLFVDKAWIPCARLGSKGKAE